MSPYGLYIQYTTSLDTFAAPYICTLIQLKSDRHSHYLKCSRFSQANCYCDMCACFKQVDDAQRLASHVQLLEMQLAAERQRNECLQQQQTSLQAQMAAVSIGNPAANRDLVMLFRELRGWCEVLRDLWQFANTVAEFDQ